MGTVFKSGWQPSRPDHRDHFFAAVPSVQASLPAQVDLAHPSIAAPWSPIWQQGDIGSCGPHSAAADLVFAGLRQQGMASVPMPSRLFIYWCARHVMGTTDYDSGVDNRSLLKALAEYGWCDESLWPYTTTDFKQRPGGPAFAQAAERKISQYLRVPQNLEQMKGCLAGGDPFIFGFSVYSSMMTGAVKASGVVPLPRLGDSQLGGHDVLIVGYSDSTRVFKFRNSWGDGWGVNGYGYIPYEYAINPQLAGDFWTVKHSALPSPVAPKPDPIPIPIPKPEPTSMFKNLFLQIIKGMVESYAAYAKATPDPMDDMIAAMLLKFLDGLTKANSHAELLAIYDEQKTETLKAFPQQ